MIPSERSIEYAEPRPGFRLTPTDIDMIRAVYEYRFLHVDHVSALVGRSYKKVHGRLSKLVQGGFLARIEFPFQKHIYVIGREGIGLLVEQGMAPRERIECRLRHHELKELFLKHQLMLVDLHCILELVCRGTALRLASWREGKELWDRVCTSLDRKRVELPVCPDSFFVLEDSSRPEGKNRLNFFVEADRSTTTHKRFEQKLRAYYEYLRSGCHTDKFGIKTFRVLTFTLTEQRALGLCAAARATLPQDAYKHFLFTTSKCVSLVNPQAMLSDIFIGPEEAGRVRLVPMN